MKTTISLFSLLLIMISSISYSQQIPYNQERSLGINYRSKENPYYWKNNPPYTDYWQQDVHYKIKATLNTKSHDIHAHQILIYYNNSPDTLHNVYFHLYQNAFQKGSWADQYSKNVNNWYRYSRHTNDESGTYIKKITNDSGEVLHTHLDNTILKVDLKHPLMPNDSVTFKIDFKTHISTLSYRMRYNPSHGFDQFTISQWYPRICVYDRKFGWTADQHFGHEFYGDFGTFEVELTLPHHFIVAATGYLLNRNEVLPPELMKKLDIKNFKDKPMGEKPSTLIKPIADSTKTWRYKAVNVHDFACTADPTYRIGKAEWNGITCYSFAREWKAAAWQDAAQFAADVVRIYSTDFGKLGYHKMIVADADQGMEYPMITMDGGVSPNYYFLLAHEIGHNWFFGTVGSNETYRAYLDEGFTSFIETWSMKKLVHKKGTPGKEKYNYENSYNGVENDYRSYYYRILEGTDAPLTVHSDKYNLTKGQYGQVYYKGVVMLYALQYVLGDELFQNAISYYFNKWKFAHPYSEDFRQAVIEYTNRDLVWFFDQWLDNAYTVDYAIKRFGTRPTKNGWRTEIMLRRKEKGIMPLDLVFHLKDGSSIKALIPVSDQVKKKPDLIVLPKWYGWGNFNDTYTETLVLPAKPLSLEIDPSQRMGDSYLLDNISSLPDIDISPVWTWNCPLDKYKIHWYPKLWYNDIDGLQMGARFRGGYLDDNEFGKHKVQFSPSVGLNFPQYPVSYIFSWQEPVHKLPYASFLKLSSYLQYGYGQHEISYTQKLGSHPWRSGESSFFNLGIQFSRIHDNSYLWTSGLWDDSPLNTVKIQYQNNYRFGPRKLSRGIFHMNLINSLPGTSEMFSKLIMESIQYIQFSKLKIRLREIFGYTTASIPASEALYLNMGSPGEWITNPWLAAKGTLPSSWLNKGHIHPAGGGNLRGYNIGSFPEFINHSQHITFGNNRLIAANIEIDLWNPLNKIPFLGKILKSDLYTFFDLGCVTMVKSDDNFGLEDMKYDAGIGLLWKPLSPPWRAPSYIKNIFQNTQIRLDFPLYVSAPASNEEEFDFRWLIGFGRAF